ncbi:MAG: glutathione peroxidase [Ferruginibacter sp.]|nr:glutathione peroxidase [Ferruginibacter sp.]
MIKFLAISVVILSCTVQANKNNAENTAITTDKSIYDFKVDGLDGKTIDFSAFKGKKILIVNTASECGYTKQYEGLQKLYETYKEKLIVVGFPANNFGGQEPGSNETIAAFCKKNYGVTFPMAAKVSVKGDDMAPVFRWLTSKSENGVMDAEIKWNFGKFLLDEKGNLIQYFPSKTEPMSEEITGKL